MGGLAFRVTKEDRAGVKGRPFLSALGQTGHCRDVRRMTALAPKAVFNLRSRDVADVPTTDIAPRTSNAAAICHNPMTSSPSSGG